MQIDIIGNLGRARDRNDVYGYLKKVKDAGVKRVYLRTHGGGRPLYPSKVAKGNKEWNPFPAAIEIGHELGLEVHGWYTLFEESHGGIVSEDLRDANLGSFFQDHSEYMQMDRNGTKYFKPIFQPGEEFSRFKNRAWL